MRNTTIPISCHSLVSVQLHFIVSKFNWFNQQYDLIRERISINKDSIENNSPSCAEGCFLMLLISISQPISRVSSTSRER